MEFRQHEEDILNINLQISEQTKNIQVLETTNRRLEGAIRHEQRTYEATLIELKKRVDEEFQRIHNNCEDIETQITNTKKAFKHEEASVQVQLNQAHKVHVDQLKQLRHEWRCHHNRAVQSLKEECEIRSRQADRQLTKELDCLKQDLSLATAELKRTEEQREESDLTHEVTELSNENAILRHRLNAVTTTQESECKRLNSQLSTVLDELSHIKGKLAEKQFEFSDARRAHGEIEREVAMFRKLLDTEQRNKKRKDRRDSFVETRPEKSQETGASRADLQISQFSVRDEAVTIENTGAESVCLAGWRLKGEQSGKEFRFPSSTKLSPGEVLTVWSGAQNQDREMSGKDEWWSSRSKWDAVAEKAVLVDPNGDQVHLVSPSC